MMERIPPVVHVALQNLEKTAFDGLVKDKIVFTVEELPVLCKDDPTCYGLLQSTECYSAEEIGIPTQSFNFLHLGIQEYFAAKYVTTLPEDEVYTLLKESFVVTDSNPDSKSVRLSNMWILYCGITSGQCKTLRHYLTTYGKPDPPHKSAAVTTTCITNPLVSDCTRSYDPLITMHGAQTIMKELHSSHDQPITFPAEIKEHTTSCMQTSSYLTYGCSINQRTSETTITISQDMLKDPVMILYLFQCFNEAQDNTLCEFFSKLFDSGVINIGHNRLLPHQVVCLGLFLSKSHRQWKKLNLNMCHIGDHGLSILHQYLCGINKQKVREINLDDNGLTGASSHLIACIISYLQPHTLHLHNNNITNVKDISTAVITTSTVKVLDMGNNGLTAQDASAISDMMICLEELYIYTNKLGDHGAELLSEGITNTKTLRVLDISNNNIGPQGTTAIANALSNNTSLEELYIINPVGQDGATALGKAITNNKKLNKLSLYCDYHQLNDTMDKESAMILIKSLYNNNAITKLDLPITLYRNDISDVTEEAEKVNSKRKLYKEHIIDFNLLCLDLQDNLTL